MLSRFSSADNTHLQTSPPLKHACEMSSVRELIKRFRHDCGFECSDDAGTISTKLCIARFVNSLDLGECPCFFSSPSDCETGGTSLQKNESHVKTSSKNISFSTIVSFLFIVYPLATPPTELPSGASPHEDPECLSVPFVHPTWIMPPLHRPVRNLPS